MTMLSLIFVGNLTRRNGYLGAIAEALRNARVFYRGDLQTPDDPWMMIIFHALDEEFLDEAWYSCSEFAQIASERRNQDSNQVAYMDLSSIHYSVASGYIGPGADGAASSTMWRRSGTIREASGIIAESTRRSPWLYIAFLKWDSDILICSYTRESLIWYS